MIFDRIFLEMYIHTHTYTYLDNSFCIWPFLPTHVCTRVHVFAYTCMHQGPCVSLHMYALGSGLGYCITAHWLGYTDKPTKSMFMQVHQVHMCPTALHILTIPEFEFVHVSGMM